jgi:hypothetical protein
MKKRSLFGLLALFIAFSCMGVKCQKVADPSADFSLPYENQNFSSRAECVQWCHDNYQPLLLEENERHQEAMFLCGDDNECKKEANRVHQEEVKRIQSERTQCVRSCHDQGTVGGGF